MKSKKILIANDLKSFIEKEKGILSRGSFEIFTAASAEEALRIHSENRVDMIIADLEMNGMGGYELARTIRNTPGLNKVAIVLTCFNRPSDIEKCRAAGANAYAFKPLVPEDFYEKVTRLLSVPDRQSMRVLIKSSVSGVQDDTPFFCMSEDISEAGMLIEADRTLAKGDILTCSFLMPGGKELNADAEVVRLRQLKDGKTHYGVKFKNLPRAARTMISEYVSSMSKKPPSTKRNPG